MKIKFGSILAATLSAVLLAQVAVNAQPALAPAPGASPDTSAPPALPPQTQTVAPVAEPAPAPTEITNAPPAKPVVKKKKKHVHKKAASTASAVPATPLVPNSPAVAKQNNVNVRGQANINSEVVGHLKKGDTVMVLEVVTLKHPKMDEPAKWAKITLPADAHTWVKSSFIDTNGTVIPKKLNMRTGPGENFSVVGLLRKGDTVKSVTTKEDWTQIEAPTNAYAFVAAHLLAPQELTPTNAMPEPTQAVVAASAPIAAPSEVNTPPPIATPAVPEPLAAPAAPEPPPVRIVEREGIVSGMVSILAPTHYKLANLDDGAIMDYLYTTSTNLAIKRYDGMRVHVTGEEGLDERWPNVPVLTIEKIQVVK